MGLVDEALAGSIRATARLATLIENDDVRAAEALDRLYPHSGKAHTVGVTGPPGAGKSSLVNALVAAYRAAGSRVAVIAVDPSSPLSGGAALGDRIRMLEHHGDPGVFIRSAASRGRLGGLAPATAGLIHLFDAVGFDVIIVETVGVGQEEIDVVHYVESVVLVQVPGLGDGVQALKAGVLEVADIYVVNKSDLPGANLTARELRAMLTLSAEQKSGWAPPVVDVSAKDGRGVRELADALERHRAWLGAGGRLADRRREIAKREIGLQVRRLLDARLDADRGGAIEALASRVAERQLTPYRAAAGLLTGSQQEPVAAAT
ncbi:MAG: methylmalonyl Co-A mutase-associated GTPase MeaB [Thermomicrobiales bacterium]|nr:methylmalonyl Co-A mutase-associated GTPase MeaB [Thermomicrobiales bacterium]